MPAPLGPRKPVTRPGSTRAEKSDTAVIAPNRFVTPENSSTCPSGIPNPLVVVSSSPYLCGNWARCAGITSRRLGDSDRRSARESRAVTLRGVTDVSEPRVLVRTYGGLGHLTLNRPRAINALDLGMIGDLAEALDAWQDDTDVDIVLLDGAGDRGLCAGGDVRGLAEQISGGRPEDTGVFFRAEYALNARIAEYPKPIVAIADGITMGGGIGLAGHAAIRIVTERSKLAMPETRIGFTPDVGGTWLLAHAPGRLGEYLGLTGAVDERLRRDLRRVRRPLRAGRPARRAARRARDPRGSLRARPSSCCCSTRRPSPRG